MDGVVYVWIFRGVLLLLRWMNLVCLMGLKCIWLLVCSRL